MSVTSSNSTQTKCYMSIPQEPADNYLDCSSNVKVDFPSVSKSVPEEKWKGPDEMVSLVKCIDREFKAFKELGPNHSSYEKRKAFLEFLFVKYEMLERGPDQFVSRSSWDSLKDRVEKNIRDERRRIHSTNGRVAHSVPWNGSTRIEKPLK